MKVKSFEMDDVLRQRALLFNTSKRYIIIKRIFDIVASLLGIILISPVLLVIAIAIKLDSQGTILFSQKRCGLKGKIFRMYKFRSMISGADDIKEKLEFKSDVKGYMFKMRNDPRVTRVGRFLRKTSLDELPQFFNVLRGEMSFVGPRPPLLHEVVQYEEWHKLRMSVKPGITGLWQVEGRSELDFNHMIRLDLKYMRERSFLYDLKIIFKTVPLLFGDKRAF